MVVPATVAAVRPAGTNHALSLIKIVIFSNIGFVGGADVGGDDISGDDVGGDDVGRDDVGGDDVGGDDVRTAGDKVGDGGGGRPDHHDKPLANRLRRPPPPISGGRGGVSLNGGSGSNLNLSSSSSSVHFALNTSYFPLLIILPNFPLSIFPFPSPSPLPSLKFVLNFPAWSILENESPNLYILISKLSHKYS